MPTIRQYDNPADAIRPNDMGIEAAVQEGRRVGSFFHQAGEAKVEGARVNAQADEGLMANVKSAADLYEQHQTQQELLHGMATEATMLDGLTQQWTQTASQSDPNDPNTAKNFREQVIAPALQQFQSSFQTKQGKLWAAERAASMQQHFFEKTAADQATLAGQAAVQNLETQQNRLTSFVSNSPESFDIAAGTADAGLEAYIKTNPNLTPEQVAALRNHNQQFKSHLAETSIQSLAIGNPDAARQVLASGKFADYLDGQQLEASNRYIDSAERMNIEKQKAADAAQRKQMEDEGHAAFSQIWASMQQSDGSLRAGPGTITAYQAMAAKYGAVIPGEVASMGNAIEEMNRRTIGREDVHSDPTTYRNLTASLLTNKAGATKDELKVQVDTAYARGRLSNTDYQRLHEMAEDAGDKAQGAEGKADFNKQMNDFFASIKPNIGGTDAFGNFVKPDAAQRFYQFQADTMNAVKAARAAGKTDDQISATLLNPRDPAYLGNRTGAYVLTQQQQQALAQQNLRGGYTSVAPPTAGQIATQGQGNAQPIYTPAQQQQNLNSLSADDKAFVTQWRATHKQ